MIEINDTMITFDLMKEIPDKLRLEFNFNWRNMDSEYIKKFLKDWRTLPRNRAIIEFLKKDYNEIIIKDLFGRDIFSFEIDKGVFVMISQYEGFWNMTYSEYNGKIIIFTG